ncbi:MAG: hypothetical protein Q9220_006143 [cf. Caloplaca sp. 1 TL-2023]
MAQSFNKSAHIRYFLRCLKTYLPTAYTANDSQRMTLAFFVLCALDLLDALDSNITEEERLAYVDWIYRCQHPSGGFRGFTGTDVGEERTEANEHWDPANIAAAYFALANLAILGDDLQRVKRRECLDWLKRLQLSDGTFGEAVGKDGQVQGGRDMRFCYCAAVIKWTLSDGNGDTQDIDVDGLMRFLEASQTYEGGFANGPFHEAQAGWTYCALGAITLLGKLETSPKHKRHARAWPSDDSIHRLVGWLAGLQTSVLHEEEPPAPSDTVHTAQEDSDRDLEEASPVGAVVVPPEDTVPDSEIIESIDEHFRLAGMTGRCNKIADTCYTFWAGGSLALLQSLNLLDLTALRTYLLEKTQHRIGGFSKLPGDPPDIMHSCLGLAGLAAMGEADLKPFDPALCLSYRARQRLENLSWR